MLSTLLVTLVQIAFAAEMTNPLIKALASGCGSRVYTETIEASAIDEMTTCYQMGLNELPRKRLPTMELAFQTCGSFKLELRQFACLDGFKNEAREPKLHKIFNDCANTEKDLLKKSLTTLACLKTKKTEYPTTTEKNFSLTPEESLLVETTKSGCSDSQSISSTQINKEEVEALANCYQNALINMDLSSKRAIPNAFSMSLDLCDNFTLNSQKVECVKRVASTSKQDGMKKAVDLCLNNSRKNAKKKGQGTFRHPEDFYAKGFECLRDEFQILSHDAKQPNSTLPASSGNKSSQQ